MTEGFYTVDEAYVEDIADFNRWLAANAKNNCCKNCGVSSVVDKATRAAALRAKLQYPPNTYLFQVDKRPRLALAEIDEDGNLHNARLIPFYWEPEWQNRDEDVFMVDDAHIDVLIDSAQQLFREARTFSDLEVSQFHWLETMINERSFTEIGRMLLAQNARSVGDIEEQNRHLTYIYRPTGRKLSSGATLGAIECYIYQAYKTNDWRETEARSFCMALKYLDHAVSIADLEREYSKIPLPVETSSKEMEWTDEKLGRAVA